MLSPEKMQVLFDAVKGSTPQSPAEHVFVAVMTELPYLRARTKDTHELAQQLEAIFLTTKNEQIMRLERHLNMLATISSSAPFIGLFGTVWGIMTSFQAIAASKTTSLAVVAPGIAESLLATAFGLVAAIPALIFYNILIGKVDRIEQKTSNFWIKLKSCVIAKQ
jgi:biopolymer transport protein TolQ